MKNVQWACDGVSPFPELYAHLNPMPFAAAAQMEKDLRRAGYTGTGGIDFSAPEEYSDADSISESMNPFSTDHPMMSEPSALARRVQRRLLVVTAGYLVYILLLGPLFALDGHGYLNFVPESIGSAVVLPAAPVARVPGLRRVFRDYLDWWYHDPNDPYSSPDWR